MTLLLHKIDEARRSGIRSLKAMLRHILVHVKNRNSKASGTISS